MTANIQQNVIPRHFRRRAVTSRHYFQQGNVSQSTLTIGFAILSLVTTVVLGFLYLQQVFGTATHGSNIQALEQTMIELKEQQKQLELEGAQLRSIQSVEERVEQMNLVSATNVGYLAAHPDRVAQHAVP
jgi:hypothetical protein